MKPFHFAVMFWGDHYREHYFIDKFLRSMLAPGNWPLLDYRDGHKLVIATTLGDWRKLNEHPIIDEVKRHVWLHWVEIDYPEDVPDDNVRTKAILHQHKWMDVLLRETHDRNAFGSIWSPDCMASMGLVERMLEWRGQYDCVICPVLRQAEEPLLEEIGDERWFGPRETIDLSIRHLHREMWPFIEPIHKKMTHAPYRLWRMPGNGLLLHGFFGLPIFMDYAIVGSDYRAGNIDTCLRTGNFSECKQIHVVSDSDEVSVISLTPQDLKNYAEFPEEELTRYDTLRNIRTSYQFHAIDRARVQMFRTPIRWHVKNLDAEWRAREAEIEREVWSAIGENWFARLRFDFPLVRDSLVLGYRTQVWKTKELIKGMLGPSTN